MAQYVNRPLDKNDNSIRKKSIVQFNKNRSFDKTMRAQKSILSQDIGKFVIWSVSQKTIIRIKKNDNSMKQKR